MEVAEADTRKPLGYNLWYRSGIGRGCSSVAGQRFLVQLSSNTLGGVANRFFSSFFSLSLPSWLSHLSFARVGA
jgi:hypothetical protein